MPLPYIAPSVSNAGSAAAPGAGGDVAVLPALPGGAYEVTIVIALDGTAETAKTNLQLLDDAVVVTDLPTISAQVVEVRLPRVDLAPASVLTVEAVGAATGGSIYTVQLTATKLS